MFIGIFLGFCFATGFIAVRGREHDRNKVTFGQLLMKRTTFCSLVRWQTLFTQKDMTYVSSRSICILTVDARLSLKQYIARAPNIGRLSVIYATNAETVTVMHILFRHTGLNHFHVIVWGHEPRQRTLKGAYVKLKLDGNDG